jgi:hypothetical protein
MKNLFFLFILCIGYLTTIAQPVATMLDFKQGKREAIMMDLPYSSSVIEQALMDTMRKQGYIGKTSGDYLIFKSVQLDAIAAVPLDWYIKIDRKSRKEKDLSTVTMLIGKDINQYVSSSSDPAIFTNAMAYMNGWRKTVSSYDLQLQINDQAEIIRDQDRKIKNLSEQSDDLAKRKKELEEEILLNQKNRDALLLEKEAQISVLEKLKSRKN